MEETPQSTNQLQHGDRVNLAKLPTRLASQNSRAPLLKMCTTTVMEQAVIATSIVTRVVTWPTSLQKLLTIDTSPTSDNMVTQLQDIRELLHSNRVSAKVSVLSRTSSLRVKSLLDHQEQEETSPTWAVTNVLQSSVYRSQRMSGANFKTCNRTQVLLKLVHLPAVISWDHLATWTSPWTKIQLSTVAQNSRPYRSTPNSTAHQRWRSTPREEMDTKPAENLLRK